MDLLALTKTLTNAWLAVLRRPTRSALRSMIATASLVMAQAAFAEPDLTAAATPTTPQPITDAYVASYPEVQNLLALGNPTAALKAIQHYLPTHENDPNYFYLTGLIALKAGDHIAAAAAFERVVLMQPENAGAWMDLAIASTETGRFASATSYFNYIESEFAPPPALQAVIASYRARIASPPLSTDGFNLQAEMFVGTDSNANSGLQNSSIPLTVGTDLIELPLDPSYHARSDQFVQVAAGGTYRRRLDVGVFELAVNLRQRSYLKEHDFSTVELTLGAGLRRPTDIGDFNLGLQASHLNLGGAALMHTLVAVGQFEHTVDICRLGLGLEAEGRRYFSLTSLDANLLWGQAGVGCNWKTAWAPMVTALIARTGIDRPTGNRAGGRTRHNEWILQASSALVWGINADLSYTIARAADAAGYSPLLENFAAREIDRRSARLALSRVVGKGVEAILVAEDNRVLSNLSLFRQSGRVLSVGVKKIF
jgi:tetratricopeptide (TPR) repeat protein